MTVPPTAIKVLRFMKLSKMLRLARLKKLMMKYEQSFTFNQYRPGPPGASPRPPRFPQ
jgi:hypothetical protein